MSAEQDLLERIEKHSEEINQLELTLAICSQLLAAVVKQHGGHIPEEIWETIAEDFIPYSISPSPTGGMTVTCLR